MRKYMKTEAFRNMQKMCFGNVGIPVFQLLKTDQAINVSRKNIQKYEHLMHIEANVFGSFTNWMTTCTKMGNDTMRIVRFHMFP